MPTIFNDALNEKVLNVILGTVVRSANRNDLWNLSVDIAVEITCFIQQRDKETQASLVNKNPKRERVDLAAKLAINKNEEKTALPNTTGGADVSNGALFSNSLDNTTQKTTLPEKNLISPALDDLESPAGCFPDSGPVWMAKKINLDDYWVYDYSNPCTTKHGNCGGECVLTELWLVHRRKYKLSVVDVEFRTIDALREFLDPRKELARENKITPLEKIDEELAGKQEKLCKECRAARKQTQFNRFIELYHQFNGDPAKISATMGIQKQSVYAYKNKAKDMGLLR